ncbi:hypothetical protein DPMN_100750 [Dreissena polymorpha]|uniref:Uncharacterized protein n=3 Tax=Dreissena polymorpha TaxID=45954 RepID=A0A9D4LHH1_DREPO|nr:hypothetical protein DPMN_100750 [Dreissena polymorpha]
MVILAHCFVELDSNVNKSLYDDDLQVKSISDGIGSLIMAFTGDSIHSAGSNRRTVLDDAFFAEAFGLQDDDGDGILHMAIIQEDTEFVLNMIDQFPIASLINMRNNIYQTPLHLAVATNQPGIVKSLICACANLGSCDKNGDTPLHVACKYGYMECIKELLHPHLLCAERKDLSARNFEGLTCLHIAFTNNHVNIMEALLEAGVDINLTEGKTGRTILHNACLSGNVIMVRLLIRYKDCNFDALSYDSLTPFDLACVRNHDEITMILAAIGAQRGTDVIESRYK